MTGRKSQGLYSGHYNMKRLKEKAYNGDEKDQSVRKEIKSSWHSGSGMNKAGYRGEHDDVFSASAQSNKMKTKELTVGFGNVEAFGDHNNSISEEQQGERKGKEEKKWRQRVVYSFTDSCSKGD